MYVCTYVHTVSYMCGHFVNASHCVHFICPISSYLQSVHFLSLLPPHDSHSSIVQGADWYYGPEKPYNGTSPVDDHGNLISPPNYMKYTALATALAAFVFFVLYLVYQVCVCVCACVRVRVCVCVCVCMVCWYGAPKQVHVEVRVTLMDTVFWCNRQ